MIGCLLLVSAIAWITANSAAHAGLSRLEGQSAGMNSKVVWSGGAGALCGLVTIWIGNDAGVEDWMAAAALLFLFPYLLTGAFLDACTACAPMELIVPACIFAGVAGAEGFVVGDGQPLFGIAAGLGLYVLARIIWSLQCMFRKVFLPPSDVAAMLLPVVLFDSAIAAACYASLATVSAAFLGICRSPAFGCGGSSASNAGEIASSSQAGTLVRLLAIAFPLVAVFLLVDRIAETVAL